MEISKEQLIQAQRRKSESSAVILIIFGLLFFVFALFGHYLSHLEEAKAELGGIIWISLLVVVVGSSIYFSKVVLANKLDKKYPLTKGFMTAKKSYKIENFWQFLAGYWWLLFIIAGLIKGFFKP